MEEELRDALEKHLFNYNWGHLHGGGSKVFPSTDIRSRDSAHTDFTLQAPNLKEALAMIKKGNFVVCPIENPFVPSAEDPGKKDPKLFTASGCPPLFPHATQGLVKAKQRGGTGGEEDWTTYHAKTQWEIIFQHENQSVTWNLLKKEQHSSMGNIKDGVNRAEPSLSGNIHCSTVYDSPQQHLMKNPLKGEKKERERIRRALKDTKAYLLDNPHKRQREDSRSRDNEARTNGNPKEGHNSGVEKDSCQEVSPRPKKVGRHWPFSFTLHYFIL